MLRYFFIFLVIFLFGSYVVYYLQNGQYTLDKLLNNPPAITEQEERLAGLQLRHAELKNLTDRLRDGSIDLDLLEELARIELYYVRDNEIVLPLEKKELK